MEHRDLKPIYHLWLAGKVIRSHTVPTIRKDNIAEHTFGVLLLLFRYFPIVSINAIGYALHHDLPEYASGDIPHPAKQRHPEFKKIADEVEAEFAAEFSLVTSEGLSPEEKIVVRICDLAEFVMFRRHEARLGNSYSSEHITNAIDLILKERDKLPEESVFRFMVDNLLKDL